MKSLVQEYGQVVEMVVDIKAKKATKYISDKLVIKGTYHGKRSSRDATHTIVLTVGRPNFQERKFIKRAKKAKRFPPEGIIIKPGRK